MERTAFIGHRWIYNPKEVKERLRAVVEERILSGCNRFIMGTHGAFDEMALDVCRTLREVYPDITIEVALTSYHTIEKRDELDYVPYQDVQTVMFDIKDFHFKKQITESNKQMIDSSDALICYVDKKQSPSGAKTAMNYAKRKDLKIINLFKESDKPVWRM